MTGVRACPLRMLCPRRSLRRCRALVWLGAFLALTAVGVAAQQTPLAALVPEDAGLCVELRGLGPAIEQFTSGELYQRLRAHSLVQLALLRHGQGLNDAGVEIRKRLGLTPRELFVRLLGDEFLFAVWPGEPADSPPVGLQVLRTSEHELLRRTVEHIAGGQAGGALPRTTLEYGSASVTVYQLELGKKQPSLLLAVAPGEAERGSLAVLTNHRATLEAVLAAHHGSPTNKSLASTAAYQQSQSRLATTATLRVFLQPRSWDRLLLAEPTERNPRAEAARHLGQQTWQAIDHAVAAVELNENLAFEAYASWQREQLPQRATDLLAAFAGKPTFGGHIPADAVVAAQGRLDLRRVFETLFQADRDGVSLLKPAQSGAEWGLPAAIASSLGPDVGGFLVPARPAFAGESPVAWPLDWLVVVETQAAHAAPGSPAPAAALMPLLRAALDYAVAADQARDRPSTSRVEHQTIDALTVTRVQGIKSIGEATSVSFTAIGNFVWGSSSIDALRSVAKATDTASASRPGLETLRAPASIAPSHLLVADLSRLRRLMRDSPTAVASLATTQQVDIEVAQRRWEGAIALLDFADALAAAMRVDPDSLAVSARLTASRTESK